MRKLFAIAAMSMVMAGSAAAQGGGGMGGMQMTPEMRQHMIFDRLFKEITLTDAVKAKAMEIIKKHSDEMAKIDRDAADRREQMMAHRKAQNEDLRALLTSDADKKKFDENAAAPMGRGRGGPPPVR